MFYPPNLNAKYLDDAQRAPPILQLSWALVRNVMTSIGQLPAESGGPIGGSDEGPQVTHFHFDESSRTSRATYSPDHQLLNRLFKTEWNPQRIRLRGFMHSHPGRFGRPSAGDEVYAERILAAIEDLDCLWLPIVNTVPDTGGFHLVPWAVYRTERGVQVVRAKVQVFDVPQHLELNGFQEGDLELIRSGAALDLIAIGKHGQDAAHQDAEPVGAADAGRKAGVAGRRRASERVRITRDQASRETVASIDTGATFDRVRDAYDLPLMHASRIIAVGAGGAADWLEQLSRAGLGQFVLIDSDVVTETNLATQQTYRRDIGRPKVDCIAERIRDIHPTAKTIALQKRLDDDLSDEEIRRLAQDPIDGRTARRTILCGLTDDFFAQARVNRLALKLGLPSLCAQVYKEGRGAEVTFTFPGVTPACHRCILSSRFRHFFDQGNRNAVTSHGTPIFATTRLNAIKGFALLALLHHGSEHPRWGKLLARIGKRNLVQVRMDPDFAETMGLTVFDRVFEHADQNRLLFDDTVWLPQDPECLATGYPNCPDCGGTGDLRDAIGKLADTRQTVQACATEK